LVIGSANAGPNFQGFQSYQRIKLETVAGVEWPRAVQPSDIGLQSTMETLSEFAIQNQSDLMIIVRSSQLFARVRIIHVVGCARNVQADQDLIRLQT